MIYDPDRHHRRSIRLRGYDYSQPGAYFITVCTHDRACMFGEVVDGEMQLNEYGQIVRDAWDDLPNHYAGVTLDAFVIMPNHVHGIIVLTGSPARADGVTLGATFETVSMGMATGSMAVDSAAGTDSVRTDTAAGADVANAGVAGAGMVVVGAGFKPAPTTPPTIIAAPADAAPAPTTPPTIAAAPADAAPAPTTPPTIIAAPADAAPASASAGNPMPDHARPVPLSEVVRAFKTFSARRINKRRNTQGVPVWQRNYYEHIVRDEKSLNRIREYIANNPLRWTMDRENRAC